MGRTMRQSKLLLVDDDLDLVRALRPALEEAGWDGLLQSRAVPRG